LRRRAACPTPMRRTLTTARQARSRSSTAGIASGIAPLHQCMPAHAPPTGIELHAERGARRSENAEIVWPASKKQRICAQPLCPGQACVMGASAPAVRLLRQLACCRSSTQLACCVRRAAAAQSRRASGMRWWPRARRMPSCAAACSNALASRSRRCAPPLSLPVAAAPLGRRCRGRRAAHRPLLRTQLAQERAGGGGAGAG